MCGRFWSCWGGFLKNPVRSDLEDDTGSASLSRLAGCPRARGPGRFLSSPCNFSQMYVASPHSSPLLLCPLSFQVPLQLLLPRMWSCFHLPPLNPSLLQTLMRSREKVLPLLASAVQEMSTEGSECNCGGMREEKEGEIIINTVYAK